MSNVDQYLKECEYEAKFLYEGGDRICKLTKMLRKAVEALGHFSTFACYGDRDLPECILRKDSPPLCPTCGARQTLKELDDES